MTETTYTRNFQGQFPVRGLSGVNLSRVILLMSLSAFSQTQRIELEEGKTCYVSNKYAVLVADRSDAGGNLRLVILEISIVAFQRKTGLQSAKKGEELIQKKHNFSV